MFLVRSVCLFVCLSVCLSVGWKLWTALTKFLGETRDQWVQFWWRSGSLSGSRSSNEVRNPHPQDYRITNGFWWNFYGEMGCGIETNWLHFGDDSHHYPDPGFRSGSRIRESRSGSGKNCHNSIMLTFDGGLCSLSTSSSNVVKLWSGQSVTF